jgi:hypothetical protein
MWRTGFNAPRPGTSDHETAPFALGARQLNEACVPTHSLPRLQWQILHAIDSDAAKNRDAFAFHEEIPWRLQAGKFTETCAFVAAGFVPVRPEEIVHG